MPKIGAIYWGLYVDSEDGKVEWEKYYVRSIRRGRIAATLMDETFCRVSKRGKEINIYWVKNIPQWARQYWMKGKTHRRLRPTKLQAIKRQIQRHHQDQFDSPEIAAKALVTLKRMKTRLENSDAKV